MKVKSKKGISKISILLIILIILGIGVGIMFFVKHSLSPNSDSLFNIGESKNGEISYSFNNKENYIAVKNKDEKYGFIDTNGNQKIDFKYEYAEDYINGLAIVHNEDYEEGIIDTKGNEVVKFGEFSNIYRYNESQNVISEYSNIFIATTDDGQKKLINKDGKVVTSNAYEDIDEKNGIVYFENNGKYGLLDVNGKEILTSNEEFDVEDTCDSLSVLSFDNCNKIINNTTGKVLKEIEAESYASISKHGDYYEVQNIVIIKDNKVVYTGDEHHSIIDINEDEIVHLQGIDSYNIDEDNRYIYGDIYYSLKINKNILEIPKDEEARLSNTAVLLNKLVVYEENEELYSVDKNGNKTKISNISGKKLEAGIGDNIVVLGDDKYNYIIMDIESKKNIREVGHYISVQNSLENLYGEVYEGLYYIKENEHLINNEYNADPNLKEYEYIVDSNLNKISEDVECRAYYSANNVLDFTYRLTGKNYILLMDKNEKYGLIDNKGNNIVEFKYTGVQRDMILYDNVPVVIFNKDNGVDIYDLSKEKVILSLEESIAILCENYIRVDNKIYNYDGKLIYTEQ